MSIHLRDSSESSCHVYVFTVPTCNRHAVSANIMSKLNEMLYSMKIKASDHVIEVEADGYQPQSTQLQCIKFVCACVSASVPKCTEISGILLYSVTTYCRV